MHNTCVAHDIIKKRFPVTMPPQRTTKKQKKGRLLFLVTSLTFLACFVDILLWFIPALKPDTIQTTGLHDSLFTEASPPMTPASGQPTVAPPATATLIPTPTPIPTD